MKYLISSCVFICFSFFSFGQNENLVTRPTENLLQETKQEKPVKEVTKLQPVNKTTNPGNYKLTPEQKLARRMEETPVMTKTNPITE